ncbi:hypothetical protein B296_00033789 [Ensete ventricosum]|uniref:Uncharacterized protein n=1 Tax=Ensete ventricosum TaxID=4639 RepID=A0A426ZPE9_ENSVE|nr:hypothetical protein B296_00033789 [Ensete ventricosum]
MIHLISILPLEGLNFLTVLSRGSEAIIREDLELHGLILGKVMEVARDLCDREEEAEEGTVVVEEGSSDVADARIAWKEQR